MRHSAQSEIDGVLLVDKGPGMTSHDVVAVARERLNTKKVGHCGTLDPMATGLLIVVVGKATKIQDLLMAEDKEYEGTITLGITTGTQDKEGRVIKELPVPEFSREEIEEAFAEISRRILPDPSDGQRDQEGWRAALQTRAPGQGGRT